MVGRLEEDVLDAAADIANSRQSGVPLINWVSADSLCSGIEDAKMEVR